MIKAVEITITSRLALLQISVCHKSYCIYKGFQLHINLRVCAPAQDNF